MYEIDIFIESWEGLSTKGSEAKDGGFLGTFIHATPPRLGEYLQFNEHDFVEANGEPRHPFDLNSQHMVINVLHEVRSIKEVTMFGDPLGRPEESVGCQITLWIE